MIITRRNFVGGGISLAALAAVRRPSVSATPLQAADLDTLIPELLRTHQVPGASVALVGAGGIEYERAFGLKRTQPEEAADLDTVYEAASLSKPVFAYVVLRMAERGEIDLDRPLAEYLPEPYIADEPRLERLTARLVLCHRSGFPNWARNEPLAFRNEPGERFGYSGAGYVYLQRVIERLEGKPLDAVMRERLLDPLGIESSSYKWLDAYERASAEGHNRNGIQIRKSRPTEANAAASLHTTAGDYGRFLLLVLRGTDGAATRRPNGAATRAPGSADAQGPPLDAGKLSADGARAALGEHALSDAGLTAMLAPETDVDDSVKWGLGWGLETTGDGAGFWHWGDNGPFKAFTYGSIPGDADPLSLASAQGTAVIILTNSSHGLKLAPPIIDALFPWEHPALSFRMINY